MSFNDFELAPPLLSALESMAIRTPSSVQEKAIPAALGRSSIAVQSDTGTGKTLAFLLPIFTLIKTGSKAPRAMIVCPTHELAAQTNRVAEKLVKSSGIPLKTALFLGSVALSRHYDALRDKPDVIIGTVGRLAELIRLGRLDAGSMEIVVLDEADRLFSKDLGDSTSVIMEAVRTKASLWLYSATVTNHCLERARHFRPDMEVINVETDYVLKRDIEHVCMFAEHRDKIDTIRRLEHAIHPERCLVFARTSGDVLNALMRLRHAGIPCEALHGDFDSDSRRDALDSFREGKTRYLLTSDVGARGLDIPEVSHVIMLDPPDSRESFVHRAGRTGRAGQKGISLILADSYDIREVSKLAVRFGITFKVKKLHSGELFDITLEEFFEEAQKSLDSKRDRRSKKRQAERSERGRP